RELRCARLRSRHKQSRAAERNFYSCRAIRIAVLQDRPETAVPAAHSKTAVSEVRLHRHRSGTVPRVLWFPSTERRDRIEGRGSASACATRDSRPESKVRSYLPGCL